MDLKSFRWKVSPALAIAVGGAWLLFGLAVVPEFVFAKTRFAPGSERVLLTGLSAGFFVPAALYVSGWGVWYGHRWAARLFVLWFVLLVLFELVLVGIKRIGAFEWLTFALLFAAMEGIVPRAFPGLFPSVSQRIPQTPAALRTATPARRADRLLGLLVIASAGAYMAVAVAFFVLGQGISIGIAAAWSLAMVAALIFLGLRPWRTVLAAYGTATAAILLVASLSLAALGINFWLASEAPLFIRFWLLAASGFLSKLQQGGGFEVAMIWFLKPAIVGVAVCTLLAVPLAFMAHAYGSRAPQPDGSTSAYAGPLLAAAVALSIGVPLSVRYVFLPPPPFEAASDARRIRAEQRRPQSVPAPAVAREQELPRAAPRERPPVEAPPLEGGVQGGVVGGVLGGSVENPAGTDRPESAKAAARKPTIISSTVLQQNAIRNVEPTYPEELKGSGISGAATIEVTINQRGEPVQVQMLRSDHPKLGAAAARAVMQSRYKPFFVDGRPVTVTASLVFTFRSQ